MEILKKLKSRKLWVAVIGVLMGVIPTPDEPTVEPEPDPEPEEPDISSYPDFVQPTGAHDAYQTGDIVNYNGVLYKSKINNNVYGLLTHILLVGKSIYLDKLIKLNYYSKW